MIASLNEIEGLALKAARGAGLAWGLAEEVAIAARWLAAADLDWEDDLVRLLGQATALSPPQAGPPMFAGDGIAPLCPIRTGTRLCDLASRLREGDLVIVERVSQPLWLLPFAARAAAERALRADIGWPGASVTLYGGQLLAVEGAASVLHATGADEVVIALAIEPGDAGEALQLAPGGRIVDDHAWLQLQALEARTYVPASDLSRLAGAGAGLSDND